MVSSLGLEPGMSYLSSACTLCETYREGIYKHLDICILYSSTWKGHNYDTEPREVLWRCMRKRNVPEVHGTRAGYVPGREI